MKKLLLFILPMIMLIACGPASDDLTPEEIAREKEAVVQVIKTYNEAMQKKNFAGIVPTLSEDVIFYGTDSSEIIKSLSEYKQKLTQQFNSYDQMIYGDMVNVEIFMDKRGTLASIIYGIPTTLNKGGQSERLFLRTSRTLKKEQGNWHIISGVVGIVGTSSKSTIPTPEQPKP